MATFSLQVPTAEFTGDGFILWQDYLYRQAQYLKQLTVTIRAINTTFQTSFNFQPPSFYTTFVPPGDTAWRDYVYRCNSLIVDLIKAFQAINPQYQDTCQLHVPDQFTLFTPPGDELWQSYFDQQQTCLENLAAATNALTTPRKLYYGYFADRGSQLDETFNQVNIAFDGFGLWDSDALGIARMVKYQKQTIADLDQLLFDFSAYPTITYRGTATATANMQTLFNAIQAAGVLQNVSAVYPLDEPNLFTSLTAVVLAGAIADVRACMATYPEMKNTKVAVIYAPIGNYKAIASYDWVGLSAYNDTAFFNPGGTYDQLKAQLTAKQSTMLVPGGANPWRQDPAPFYNVAMNDKQVAAFIAFIWVDLGTPPNVSLGIGNNGMATAYEAIAKLITGT